MEPKNNNLNLGIKRLDIADVLCSAGYLPPRNVQDISRFERIYDGQRFETEGHHIDADAIFDSVICSTTRKGYVQSLRKLKTDQTQLRAAGSVKGKQK